MKSLPSISIKARVASKEDIDFGEEDGFNTMELHASAAHRGSRKPADGSQKNKAGLAWSTIPILALASPQSEAFQFFSP